MWSSSRSSSTHNKHTTTESGVSHPDSYYHWALGGIDRHSPRMLWAVMGQQVKTLFAFLMVAGAASMAGSSAALLITGMHSKNPLHPPSSKAAPVVLTTCADGPEGFVLVKAMLDTPTARSGMIRVVGGVESLHSLEALELQMLGVQVQHPGSSTVPGGIHPPVSEIRMQELLLSCFYPLAEFIHSF